MKKLNTLSMLLIMALTFFSSCSNDDETDTRSDEKKILEFSINGKAAIITENIKTINISLPFDTDATKLSPTIIVSDKARINPASGTVTDFSNGKVYYTVTAENGTQEMYAVFVTIEEEPGVKYKIGDFYPDPDDAVSATGVVFWIKDNKVPGVHGMAISIDEAKRLAWSVHKVDTDCTSNDGKVNTDRIKANYNLDDYPAFKWCIAKGPEWYLPSSEELNRLRKYRDNINTSLNKIPGSTPISPLKVWYWTSSQFSAEIATGICFDTTDGLSGTYASKSLTYDNLNKSESAVRAVIAF